MGQFHFTPDDYLELMHREVPAYVELQDQVAAATKGLAPVRSILELGTGTGETARRVLANHPGARLTGIDVSDDMLAVAREALPADRIKALLVSGIQDPLPKGPFDLAISALAVHHLQGPAKADLFRRLADVLRPSARVVMGDVVRPVDPDDALTPLSPGYDFPSSVADLSQWLADAGFRPRLVWSRQNLAVISADLPSEPGTMSGPRYSDT
ncbi:MAG: class I SAM-dependent methyltransferase [Actinomycetota bacterium]|nr:class I SAM-dependent methyltransferase [Actinomycetota bacterium]